MADISKIQVDGVEYNIVSESAEAKLAELSQKVDGQGSSQEEHTNALNELKTKVEQQGTTLEGVQTSIEEQGAEIDTKLDAESIVQVTGSESSKVMSQAAVTSELTKANSAIQSVESTASSLQSKQNEMETKLTDLASKHAEQGQTIESIQTSVNSYRSEINTLKEENKQQSTDIAAKLGTESVVQTTGEANNKVMSQAAVSSELTKLSSKQTTLEQKVNEQGSAQSSQGSELSSLKTQVQSHGNDISALQSADSKQTAEIAKKLDSSSIVQTTGSETSKVMSQAVVTTELGKVSSSITSHNDRLSILEDKVMPTTFSVSGGGTFEMRATTNVTVNWSLVRDGKQLTPTALTINSTTLNPTEIAKRSYTFSGVTAPQQSTPKSPANVTYAVTATYGGKQYKGNVTASFVNPRYFGVVDTLSVNEAIIKGLKSEVRSGKSYTGTVNLNNQRVCFAYPKSYGALVAIKDANNFDYLASTTRTEVNVWGEAYYVYVLTKPVTANNFKQIYS